MKEINMELVNLTPHTINLIAENKIETIVPSGTIARVLCSSETLYGLNGFPVRTNKYGEVTGLPEPTPGKVFIVSALVAQAVKGREDILVPDGTVRDENGVIIGCTGFAVIR